MSTLLRDEEDFNVADGECRQRSTSWSGAARDSLFIMKLLIEEKEEEKVNMPLVAMALIHTLSKIFSNLTALKEQREDFAHLVADASALVTIILKLEADGKLSGSPSQYIDRLNPTMGSVYKLLTTKARRNFVKRKICFFFDLIKLKKYQGRLNLVVTDLEERNATVNISQILHDLVKEKIQLKNRMPEAREGGSVTETSHLPEWARINRGKQSAVVEESKKDGDGFFGKQIKQISETEEVIPETDSECSGGEKGEGIIYTAEPEADDDNVQETQLQTTQLKRERQHGSESAKRPPKSKVPSKPGTQRSRTSPQRQPGTGSSISGFQFINGSGTMNNVRVGTIG